MTDKTRINLTVSSDFDQLLADIAMYQKVPKTRVIMDILNEVQPILEAMRDSYEDIHNGKTANLNKVVALAFKSAAEAFDHD
jgi:hypothetical protein